MVRLHGDVRGPIDMRILFPIAVLVATVGCRPSNEVVLPNEIPIAKKGSGQPEMSSSTLSGPRWPARSEGQWLTASDERLAGLSLSDVELVVMQPLPDWGYVPVECMGPTIHSTIHNQTRLEIADIRIRVQAFRKSDGIVIAEEVTSVPGKYRTTLPNSIVERKFVLRDDDEFTGASNWTQFTIKTTLDAVRIWDSGGATE